MATTTPPPTSTPSQEDAPADDPTNPVTGVATAHQDARTGPPPTGLLHRVGRFWIASTLLEADPTTFLAVMEGCAVLRAEHYWHLRRFEYTALHADFEVLDPGSEPPLYVATFTEGKRTWRKVGPTPPVV